MNGDRNNVVQISEIPRLSDFENINIPLYTQIYDVFSDIISNGTLKPGDILPGENALAEHFSTSRGTLRQAMRFLEENGLVIRRQGRGTVVADIRDSSPDELQPYQDICRAYCIEPVDRIEVDEHYTGAGKWISGKLHIDKGGLLLMADISFMVGGTVVAFAQHFIPVGLLERFKVDASSRSSISDFILDKLVSSVARSDLELVPILNDKEKVPVLPDIACLLVQESTYDSEGNPLAFKKSYLRGDYYRVPSDRKYKPVDNA